VNHTTTIGIAAILALAALSTGAVAATAAYAGGHGDGDSFSVKSKFKQKNICWAIDDSTTTCRNNASVLGRGEENNNDNNNELRCIPPTVGGIRAVVSGTSCSATGDPNVITGGVCNAIEGGVRTVVGEQNPQATCTFPATRA
jgi:hypothetical protein